MKSLKSIVSYIGCLTLIISNHTHGMDNTDISLLDINEILTIQKENNLYKQMNNDLSKVIKEPTNINNIYICHSKKELFITTLKKQNSDYKKINNELFEKLAKQIKKENDLYDSYFL